MLDLLCFLHQHNTPSLATSVRLDNPGFPFSYRPRVCQKIGCFFWKLIAFRRECIQRWDSLGQLGQMLGHGLLSAQLKHSAKMIDLLHVFLCL